VREEVKVKKVVEQETVETQETIRREELDIETVVRLRTELASDQTTVFKPHLSANVFS